MAEDPTICTQNLEGEEIADTKTSKCPSVELDLSFSAVGGRTSRGVSVVVKLLLLSWFDGLRGSRLNSSSRAFRVLKVNVKKILIC